MTKLEAIRMAHDSIDFHKRVQWELFNYLPTVVGEATTVPRHSERVALVSQIVKEPQRYAELFGHLVAFAASVLTAADMDAVTDTMIRDQIIATFNAHTF